jgi:ketosteroid isomerase-like protein
MSEEDVAVVRRGWEAYESGDLSAMLALFSDDVVVYQAPPLPDASTFHGREGVLQSLFDWAEGFAEFDQKGEEFIDAGGGQVIVRVHQTARGAESGVAVEGEFWFVFAVGGGKFVRLDMYNDRDQAFEATSLRQ